MERNYFSHSIWDLPCWVIVGFVTLVCLTCGLSYFVYIQGKTIQDLNKKVIRYEGSMDVMRAVKEVESWNKRIYDDEYWWRKELERDMDIR